MTKFPPFSIAKFLAFVVIIAVFLVIILLDEKGQTDGVIENQYNIEKELLKRVSDYWEQGDFEHIIKNATHKCSEIPSFAASFPESFWPCNPTLMHCLLKGSMSSSFDQFFNKFFDPHKTQISVNKKGDTHLNLTTRDGKKIYLKLTNYCEERFLPEKIYSTGVQQGLKYLWDNYGRNIFIDRDYVSQYRVRLWREQKILALKRKDPKPVLSFSKKKMKKFCKDQNKRLLEAHIFDAASFYPSTYKSEGNYIFKSRYPWGNKDDEFTCKKVFTKECEQNKAKALSWMGIKNILGGEVELFENLFSTNGDLKLSSRHILRESPWHENARRGSAMEYPYEKNSTDFKDWNKGRYFEAFEYKGVAFRCMRIK